MLLRHSVLAAVACVLAGCGGGDPPKTADLVGCLRAAGASVELDPQVSHDSTDPEFVPVLTPETEVAAAGTTRAGTRVHVFVSPGGAADDAEERGLEFLRLFGARKENLLRRETALLMLRGPGTRTHVVPGRDRELARECLDRASG
jgi:hypothetical protein